MFNYVIASSRRHASENECTKITAIAGSSGHSLTVPDQWPMWSTRHCWPMTHDLGPVVNSAKSSVLSFFFAGDLRHSRHPGSKWNHSRIPVTGRLFNIKLFVVSTCLVYGLEYWMNEKMRHFSAWIMIKFELTQLCNSQINRVFYIFAVMLLHINHKLCPVRVYVLHTYSWMFNKH